MNNSTPQLVAKRIYDEYYAELYPLTELRPRIARQCALKCVTEILQHSQTPNIKYWGDVKAALILILKGEEKNLIQKEKEADTTVKAPPAHYIKADVIRLCPHCGFGMTQDEAVRGVCGDCEFCEDDGMSAEDAYEEAMERHEESLAERAAACTCGAWTLDKQTGKVYHVADCCCGAE